MNLHFIKKADLKIKKYSTKLHRPIHKSSRKSFKRLTKTPIDCTAMKVTEPQGLSFQPEGIVHEQYKYPWYSQFKQWIFIQPSIVQKRVTEIMSQFYTLTSIEELFELTIPFNLDQSLSLINLARYSQIAKILDSTHGTSILISNNKTDAVVNVPGSRHFSNLSPHILLISRMEKQMAEKRITFIEKLRESQDKYDRSLSRMSSVSEQLAFTYRMYLEQRAELSSCFQSIRRKISSLPLQNNSLAQQYTRLLFFKNIHHAFQDSQIDFYNYFKFKEHVEMNITKNYQNVCSEEELKFFIEKRRPKRGRKQFLATSCSVCLSDYYQQINPFQFCGTCGLRAHQICFSFAKHKCGYCSYQKVEREVKEKIDWCAICHQPGLMIIKFHDNEYVHAFCLLIHGYSKLSNHFSIYQELRNNGPTQVYSDTKQLNPEINNNATTQEIEYFSPFQNFNFDLIHEVNSNFQNQRAPHQSEDIQINDIIRSIGVSNEKQENQIWKNPENSQQQQCRCCGKSFFKNCFLSCSKCGQFYHSLCAFLSGFQLQIIERDWIDRRQIKTVINCCCENIEQRSLNRKYKLNYNKTVFFNLSLQKPQNENFMQKQDMILL